MIFDFVDRDLLRAIAQEHARGRRLYIGTVNLDAQRFVIWNMGAIASYDDDSALALFRHVMLASSSIPIIFPPVYLDVEADGSQYDEMHVDGGVMTQFFLFGAALGSDAEASSMRGDIYLIRNGEFSPVPEQVPRKLGASPGARSIRWSRPRPRAPWTASGR